MSDENVCTHCGQPIPHRGKGWRESGACRRNEGSADPVGVSDQQLTEWQRLSDEATPGPWEIYRYSNGGGRIHVSGDDGRPRELIADMEGDDRQIATAYNEADRELLLAARTAVPSLLAEVSRLQAQNEQLLEFKFVHQGCGVLRGKVKLARAERDAALARLAAVEKLTDEAEHGEGIVITPGFTTYYSVNTGLLRTALDGER